MKKMTVYFKLWQPNDQLLIFLNTVTIPVPDMWIPETFEYLTYTIQYLIGSVQLGYERYGIWIILVQ